MRMVALVVILLLSRDVSLSHVLDTWLFVTGLSLWWGALFQTIRVTLAAVIGLVHGTAKLQLDENPLRVDLDW